MIDLTVGRSAVDVSGHCTPPLAELATAQRSALAMTDATEGKPIGSTLQIICRL